MTTPDLGSAGMNECVKRFQAKKGRDPTDEELTLMVHLQTVYLLEVLSDKMIEAVKLLDTISDRSL